MTTDQSAPRDKPMGLFTSASMGIGAMIGAGIFALLGQVASLTGGYTPVLFIAGAIISMLSGYSYAKLGIRYPSSGGVAEYLVQGFKSGYVAGVLTVMFYLSIVIGMALVARAFGTYAAAMTPAGAHSIWTPIFTSAVIIALTIINAVGAAAVSKSERYLVAIKITLLLIFVVAGIVMAKRSTISSPGFSLSLTNVVHALALCLLAFQGFGVITNAIDDMPKPGRTLPRAIGTAIIVVAIVYVGVAYGTLLNLSVTEVIAARDYALAEAAKPSFGSVGFTIVSITALLSAASCINASLYSSAKMTLMMATVRELPKVETRWVWRGGSVGLFSTAALVLAIAVGLNLERIATLASLIFLLIYASVHLGHLRLTRETGASRPLIAIAFTINAAIFVAFAVLTVAQSWFLSLAFAAIVASSCIMELIVRRTNGPIRSTIDPAKIQSTPANATRV
jgi:amino acid transporter